MATTLTTPDLVVLSLLAEQPMHGYQLVRELERREVRDWAGISRPQVYYSLRKLLRAHLVRPVRGGRSAGPERRVYAPTAAAESALADALARVDWATQRPPDPFITWLVLSLHARPRDARALVSARRDFLQAQLAKERATLPAILADTVPTTRLAASIVRYAIRAFELELRWLSGVAKLLA